MSVAFSPDGKWVIAQGGAPEWNVTLWNWERCKQLACVPAKPLGSDAGAVRQVRFAAHDPGLASCAGEGDLMALVWCGRVVRGRVCGAWLQVTTMVLL